MTPVQAVVVDPAGSSHPGAGLATRSRSAPTATTVRFLLLIVAVLATTIVVYLKAYPFLPTKEHAAADLAACAQRYSLPDTPSVSAQNLGQINETLHRSQRCVLPIY